MKQLRSLVLAASLSSCEAPQEANFVDTFETADTDVEAVDPLNPPDVEQPLSHCEYVADHANDFAVRLNEVIRGEVFPPLQDGDYVSIINGPQGGFHVELDISTSCWYKEDLLESHLRENDLRIIDPRKDGVNLIVDFKMEDASGNTMYAAELRTLPVETNTPPFSMRVGSQLWILDPSYLMSEEGGAAGIPFESYEGVKLTVEAFDPLCNVALMPTVIEGVTLRSMQP